MFFVIISEVTSIPISSIIKNRESSAIAFNSGLIVTNPKITGPNMNPAKIFPTISGKPYFSNISPSSNENPRSISNAIIISKSLTFKI